MENPLSWSRETKMIHNAIEDWNKLMAEEPPVFALSLPAFITMRLKQVGLIKET